MCALRPVICMGGEPPLNEPQVDIVMSVYNGEKFLAEQLDSLVSQTYKNWRLIVRDDGSSDSSVKILHEYCNRHPDKIVLVSDEPGRLGACQGFARAMKYSSADYMMFCDQDDVWFPNKVGLSVAEILRLEALTPGTPIAVYTDLTVVDEKLSELDQSFWKYNQINPNHNSLNSLILDNVATGCTMIVNRALIDLALPIPSEGIVHDWWFALICSIYGRLGFLNDKTMLYRQHLGNEVGAQDFRLSVRLRRFLDSPRAFYERTTKMAKLGRLQSAALLKHIESKSALPRLPIAPLQRYVNTSSIIERKWCLIRFRMLSGHYIRVTKKFIFG
jgi:glycosyltransferase involved in cell wall biosynthesis